MEGGVIITGASGFLGREIFAAINSMSPIKAGRSDSDWNIDLSKDIHPYLQPVYALVHIAGLAHRIPRNEAEEQEFYNINQHGTEKLLEALEPSSPKKIILISTVAVYGRESGENIDENESLLPQTPYGKSKMMAEKAFVQFAKKNNIPYLILRLPLLAGLNPPGNLGQLIGMIKKRRYVRIGESAARKSILHISDVAKLIENWLSQSNPVSGIFNLTDGNHPALRDIENKIARELKIKFIPSLPLNLLRAIALIGRILPAFPLNPQKLTKLTSNLTFSDSKARKELNWSPSNALEHPWISQA